MQNALLVRFRDQKSQVGTDRRTLKEAAKKLGTSETTAVHIAINRLHRDLFPSQYSEAASTEALPSEHESTVQEDDTDIVDDIRDRLAQAETSD